MGGGGGEEGGGRERREGGMGEVVKTEKFLDDIAKKLKQPTTAVLPARIGPNSGSMDIVETNIGSQRNRATRTQTPWYETRRNRATRTQNPWRRVWVRD